MPELKHMQEKTTQEKVTNAVVDVLLIDAATYSPNQRMSRNELLANRLNGKDVIATAESPQGTAIFVLRKIEPLPAYEQLTEKQKQKHVIRYKTDYDEVNSDPVRYKLGGSWKEDVLFGDARVVLEVYRKREDGKFQQWGDEMVLPLNNPNGLILTVKSHQSKTSEHSYGNSIVMITGNMPPNVNNLTIDINYSRYR